LGTTHEGALPEKECRDSNSKCGETWTLLEIQQKLKHTRIDLLKVDIEGFEWPLFESWPELTDRGADKLVLPMQIAVEIHYQTQFSVLRAPSVNEYMDFSI
jgi:Methyltransferase FkbM domain